MSFRDFFRTFPAKKTEIGRSEQIHGSNLGVRLLQKFAIDYCKSLFSALQYKSTTQFCIQHAICGARRVGKRSK